MPRSISFGEFALDIERYELRRSGRAVKLERMPMELLILLLESDGKLVRRDTINRRLWGEHAQQDTENSVNTAVNKLRFTLRDDPREPRFIQTVVGQGYGFIAKVAVEPEPSPEPSVVARESAAQLQTEPSPMVMREAPALPAPPEAAVLPIPPGSIRSRRFLIAGLAAGLCLAVIALIYFWHSWREVTAAKAVSSEFRSIAVLPFVNLARNSDQDYIVDGMTAQLTTDLAGSTSLRVISRSSAMHYRGNQADMKELARALNVDAVLEGSFLHTGKQVRITANLIDARNDRHLWAQIYEESGDDLISMQESVTRDIVSQVSLALGTQLVASRLRPVSLKARDAYLRGQYEWNRRTLNSMDTAIAYYKEAIAADPEFAEAYAALGYAYVLRPNYGGADPAVSFQRAEDAAQQALRLSGGLAEAHTVLGAVRTDRDWDWAGAEAEYRRALQVNPSFPTARHWLSLHFSRLGKMQEAEDEIERARALDPLSSIIAADAAETAYWARNPREAIKRINNVLAADPGFAEAHLIKGKICEQEGDYEQALAEFKTALVLFGGGSNVEALRGHALALGGASEQALSIAHELEAASAHSYVSGVDIGLIYCGLRQPDPAMHWLNRAYLHRDKGVDILGIDPLFDGCRSDARFQELIKKLKL